jgi:hypothetical protein
MTERKFTPPTEFPAEYVDGNGGKVTILGRSNAHSKPLVGFDEDGYAQNYTESGAYYSDGEDICDLHDTPKRLTTWHSVYEEWVGAGGLSRSSVDRGATDDRLCVYRIERNEDGSNPEIFVEEV